MNETQDLLNLQDREKNEIKRMNKKLENRSLNDYINSGELKEIYADVYPDYKKLILERTPTYYRKESADAILYSMKDSNPVIVFLNPKITNKNEFKSYTGMSTEIFLEKVQNDEIIPTRDYYNKYINKNHTNKFYLEFFKEWNQKANDKPPVFANTLSTTFGGDREPPWKHEYLDLERYPFLFGNIRTHSELDKKVAIDFFAERFFWLKSIGRDEYVKDIIFLLDKYAEDKNNEKLFTDVIALTKYGHQIFSAHKYYAMGSTVTFSVQDYNESVNLINRLIQDRKNRNVFIDSLIEISLPLSCFLLHDLKDQLIKKFEIIIPYSNSIHENELNYLHFQKNSDLINSREQFTQSEDKLQHNLEKVSEGQLISESRIFDSRQELAETINNYNQCVERSKIRIGNLVKTSIEYCNTYDIQKIFSCGLSESFDIALQSLKLMPALINYIQTHKWQEYYNETLLPCTGIPIAVWTAGQNITWKYT